MSENIIVVEKKKLESYALDFNANIPIYIIKNYFSKNECKRLVNFCSNKNILNYHRKKFPKFFDFCSTDVLPSNVATNRIFRWFELSKFSINYFSCVKRAVLFQKKLIQKKKNFKLKISIIHYPIGGGYFDWHKHSRYPTNYGMIITLSERGKDFNQGGNEFKINSKIINLDKYNITQGDLTIFRYDLVHSISKIDPNKDLTFDSSGRWTLIMFAD